MRCCSSRSSEVNFQPGWTVNNIAVDVDFHQRFRLDFIEGLPESVDKKVRLIARYAQGKVGVNMVGPA